MFRWFDSGDVQGVEHLGRIVSVCSRTPAVRHWLQTKELADVVVFLRAGGRFPDNLVVRLSAAMVDAPPELPAELEYLPTSTVHTSTSPVRAKGCIECRAVGGDGRDQCGRCRACWDSRVKNVSYRRH